MNVNVKVVIIGLVVALLAMPFAMMFAIAYIVEQKVEEIRVVLEQNMMETAEVFTEQVAQANTSLIHTTETLTASIERIQKSTDEYTESLKQSTTDLIENGKTRLNDLWQTEGETETEETR